MNIRICGGNRVFLGFLRQLGQVRVFPDAAGILEAGFEEGLLVVLLPDYAAGERLMKEPPASAVYGFREWKSRGVRFYVENYPSRNYLAREVFSFFLTGNECHFNQDCILWQGELLQARNLFYFPAVLHGNRERKVLAEGGNFLGTNAPVQEAAGKYPVLLDDLEGCVAALMNLSACDALFLRPRCRWKKLISSLWSNLTGTPLPAVEDAFDNAWPEIFGVSRGTDAEYALEQALAWHCNSGLLPEADGSEGIFEMFMSGDYSLRQNYRTDGVLMTAALLAGAGAYRHCPEKLAVAEKLAVFLLDRGIQGKAGFLHWYDHSKVVYANDAGRHGLALLYLWRVTRNPRYLDCARRLAEACLGWLGEDGLYCGVFTDGEANAGKPSRTPVFYGEMAAFLLCLGTDKARQAVLRFADLVDLASQAMGHSKPDAWSRTLLLYASVHVLGGRDSSEILRELLGYYRTLQEPCGGFREEDMFPRTNVVEAAVACGTGQDRIGDQLYCNNYLFLSLALLRRGRLEPELQTQVEQMYRKVKAYLLDIQISSQDSRFNGAWMRAYNMDLGEYHGMAKDADWGPYCMMTGWVMAYIPLVLLEDLGGPAFLKGIWE